MFYLSQFGAKNWPSTLRLTYLKLYVFLKLGLKLCTTTNYIRLSILQCRTTIVIGLLGRWGLNDLGEILVLDYHWRIFGIWTDPCFSCCGKLIQIYGVLETEIVLLARQLLVLVLEILIISVFILQGMMRRWRFRDGKLLAESSFFQVLLIKLLELALVRIVLRLSHDFWLL